MLESKPTHIAAGYSCRETPPFFAANWGNQLSQILNDPTISSYYQILPRYFFKTIKSTALGKSEIKAPHFQSPDSLHQFLRINRGNLGYFYEPTIRINDDTLQVAFETKGENSNDNKITRVVALNYRRGDVGNLDSVVLNECNGAENGDMAERTVSANYASTSHHRYLFITDFRSVDRDMGIDTALPIEHQILDDGHNIHLTVSSRSLKRNSQVVNTRLYEKNEIRYEWLAILDPQGIRELRKPWIGMAKDKEYVKLSINDLLGIDIKDLLTESSLKEFEEKQTIKLKEYGFGQPQPNLRLISIDAIQSLPDTSDDLPYPRGWLNKCFPPDTSLFQPNLYSK